MASDRPYVSLGWIANTAAVVACLFLLGTLLLWARSPGVGEERVFQTADNRFHFISRDGRVVVGVTETNSPTLFRWGRRRAPNINSLAAGGGLVVGDLFGWGVALPHWLIGGALAVVPLWWCSVSRDRAEFLRRQQRGLCRHCGYDLRASPDVCPECGRPARRGDWAIAAAGEADDGNGGNDPAARST